MIEGVVNAALEAVLRLPIRDPSGWTREIEAVVDTGYSGFLTLPLALVAELELPFVTTGTAFLADGTEVRFKVHDAVIVWDGRPRPIEVDATGNRPLVGMDLLHRHSLFVEVVEGGQVEILRRE